MTALAGVISFGGCANQEFETWAMLRAQHKIGPKRKNVIAKGSVAIGHGLFPILPEDQYDSQPIFDSSSGLFGVADARLDNREEVCDYLGISRASPISDAGLALRAFAAARVKALDVLYGDFALAVWDGHGRLFLARDTAGQRPLHYYRGLDFVAFASLASGLHAIDRIPCRANRAQVAAYVADIPQSGRDTFYQDIFRVEPGHVVEITRDRVASVSYWELPKRIESFKRDEEYIEAFRTELDRATKARLRGATSVGSYLSAGLDSGAVTATAARLLGSPGKVFAFTAAPREGFCGPTPAGRLADESTAAAAVAAEFSNVEHVIIRCGSMSLLDILDRDSCLYEEPVGFPCNNVWYSTINAAAQDRNLRVTLSGAAGNLTLTAGGLSALNDYIATGRWLNWAKEAKMLVKQGLRTRGVLAASFSPWIPRVLWDRLIQHSSSQANGADGKTLLTPEAASSVYLGGIATSKRRPVQGERAARWQLFREYDPGNYRKGVLARWGIDERDPTADRRLAEFCFSLPVDQLIRDGVTRRLAKASLADRLPQTILNGPRGYQFADWFECLDPNALRRAASRLQGEPRASHIVNFERLNEIISSWPASGWENFEIVSLYRMALLRAISAEAFLSSCNSSSAVADKVA